uniref:Mitochondrial pyruvate carrier n=1 Tax=Cajanus cajan TaxID=3821 RepID=A0A151RJ46_CAJCA|nr:Brain protein 44-like protein [Cajanus cajan]
MDTKKPPETISVNMTGVMCVYSVLCMRFAWMVRPRNLHLLVCHASNETVQLYQLSRWFRAQSQMQEEIHKRLQKNMQRQLQEHMQSLSQQFQQSSPLLEPFIARVSTKGSCASIDLLVTATGPSTSNKCELFVDGSLDPVGIGQIHILGSTIHHQVMGDDMVRVSVLDVRQPEARVPVPTEEVQTMGQALNTFLQWPHKLVKVISMKDIVTSPKGKGTVIVTPSRNLPPIKRLWRLVADMEDDEQPKQLPWPPEVFNMSSKVPLYISQSDISEITNGHYMLNISILQLWLIFIHKLSVDKGNDHIYGFLEPESIQKSGNKVEEIQAYIQNWMSESNKKVYLAPYFSDAHWQLLVICPMDNIAVCICSLHKPPPTDFRQLLDR